MLQRTLTTPIYCATIGIERVRCDITEEVHIMATIQKRGDSYSIRVSCGYDSKGKQVIQSMTWKPEPKMTAKQIEKELNRQAVMFEEACNKGYQSKEKPKNARVGSLSFLQQSFPTQELN